MKYPRHFSVIVIGGGHAGVEAAAAAARMGMPTALLTHSLETIGQMSCNPAIGGVGKGHMVREVDALGGVMGGCADRAGIQFRTLNAGKGAAVRATRGQMDRALYRRAVRRAVEGEENLALFQGEVCDLSQSGGRVTGAVTKDGVQFCGDCVVLTAGTFLGGRMHVGLQSSPGGRAGDSPSDALAERLRGGPFRVGRLKTGTPPRLDGRTIDFAALTVQPGDSPPPFFSFLHDAAARPRQVPCHITHTNPRTHDIIRANLARSPMFTGAIGGAGPRYCPSVEDKVVRFAGKTAHQIFVEPEGLDTREIYPNGISTSLPFDVQWAVVRSIRGFERARITRPGYAIEYDFFDPRDLRPGLESGGLDNLFFAGQINGTTGYEEAAGQGLIAGINAALRARGDAPWQPRRDQAYIGVMLDDLATRGASEPYRMFTSRAEYRLLLREDNADLRLTDTGRRLGLVDDARWRRFAEKRDAVAREQERLKEVWVRPADAGASMEAALGRPLSRESRAADLLRRPGVTYGDLVKLPAVGPGVGDAEVAAQVEVQARYDGYLRRQQQEIARQRRHEETALPAGLDYSGVTGLSTEAAQKLNAHRPATIGQAARMDGVTPAAVSLLLVHLKKRALRKAA